MNKPLYLLDFTQIFNKGATSMETLQKFIDTIKNFKSDFSIAEKKLSDNALKIQKDNDALVDKIKKNLADTDAKIKEIKDSIAKTFESKYKNEAINALKADFNYFGISEKSSTVSSLNSQKSVLKSSLVAKKDAELALVEASNDLKLQLNNNAKEHEDCKAAYTANLQNAIKDLKGHYEYLQSIQIKNYSTNHTLETQEALIPQIGIGNYLIKADPILAECKITKDKQLKIPCVLDLKNDAKGGNILIDTTQSTLSDTEIENIMVGLVLKYMETIPLSKIKIGLCSGIHSELESFGALVTPETKEAVLLNKEIAFSNTTLDSLLNTISTVAADVDSKIKSNRASSIFDLYGKGVSTEPFQIIVIHSMLQFINSEDTLRKLCGMITSGLKKGVRFIIVDKFDKKSTERKNPEFLEKIRNLCNIFTVEGNKIFSSINNDINEFEFLKIDDSFSSNDTFYFCKDYCEAASQQKNAVIPLEKIGFDKPKSDDDDCSVISIPVAYNAPNAWEMVFKVKEPTPIASFIVGSPGSGKSTILENLILNGAMKYSPDELQFYIMDFKDGMVGEKYLNQTKIPHVKLSCETVLQAEDSGAVLNKVLLEKEQRNAIFKNTRNKYKVNINDIVDYNRFVKQNNIGKKIMPRILLIVDECQLLFSNEEHAKQCERIIRECRSVGIHFVLSTQAIDTGMRKTFSFIDAQYCFKVTREVAEVLFPNHRELKSLAEKLPNYTLYATNDKFENYMRVANAYPGDGKAYAEKIREKWGTNYDVIKIGDKSPLLYKEVKDMLPPADNYMIPFGTDLMNSIMAVSVKHNLWICGDKETAKSATMNVWYSIIKGLTETKSKIFLVDADVDNALARKISNGIKNNNISFYGRKDYMKALNDVRIIYKNREDEIDNDKTDVYLIVNQVHDIPSYRDNEKQGGNQAPSTVRASSAPTLGSLQSSNYDSSSSGLKIGSLSSADYGSSSSGPKIGSLSSADYDGASILAAYGKKNNQTQLKAREGLFDLILKGLDYNVHVLLAFASDKLSDSNSDPLFDHNQRNILKSFKSKIVLKNGSCDSIVETNNEHLRRFSSIKASNDEQDNIALLVSNDTSIDKVRFIQY